jgi:hypothetical protein
MQGKGRDQQSAGERKRRESEEGRERQKATLLLTRAVASFAEPFVILLTQI